MNTSTKPMGVRIFILVLLATFLIHGTIHCQDKPEQNMDEMWGEQVANLDAADADRGQLFKDGNYAMFIHWGLYAMLAGKYGDSTYYGISEWIMHPRRAGIPVDEYKKLAADFNPVEFDAKAIVKLAKDAGMKYIIHTSKHHDGFAMYHSKVSDFNIVDATPFQRDPIKELAMACKAEGIGFGFYYSQNQDWTTPGGGSGPEKDALGREVSFDEYFNNKCLPQVEEITTQYGDMVLIWFDTPGKMPKKYAEKLIEVVHRNQAKAFVSGRVGHGLGDYRTLGDMEIPHENVDGLWEAVDVTNDSWGYAWYDENWKAPKDILTRLISTIARGGTYMLNIGPKSDGSVSEHAAHALRVSGEWIKKYPQVIYGVEASPWEHALPWGDVTRKNNRLYLSVYEWPRDGKLYLPGLKNEISSVYLLEGEKKTKLTYSKQLEWNILDLPPHQTESFVSVIELEIRGDVDVDPVQALDPDLTTCITAHFSQTEGCKVEGKRWMEKFGEWISIKKISQWEEGGTASWEVDVLEPGIYKVELTYAGTGRLVWSVEIDGGMKIQNQQNSSHIFDTHPIGWMKFERSGKHRVSVSLVNGDPIRSELSAINFTQIDFGE